MEPGHPVTLCLTVQHQPVLTRAGSDTVVSQRSCINADTGFEVVIELAVDHHQTRGAAIPEAVAVTRADDIRDYDLPCNVRLARP
ncbi:hypothetical protein KLPMCK419B_27085 [Klebsiella pneumoniae]|nr:Uncharacterised protein [Klebsiella pneumoniae]VAN63329.1 Uncharacterised protein [Klebsiella pneumoniae]VVL17703.1 Uncharacterised protein [Klebsiella pneumoniae]